MSGLNDFATWMSEKLINFSEGLIFWKNWDSLSQWILFIAILSVIFLIHEIINKSKGRPTYL